MQPSDLLTIAGIHATILSIIAAAIGISVSIVNSKKLDILEEASKEQRVIESMFPIGDARFVPARDPHYNTTYNTDLKAVRSKLLSEFPQLATTPPKVCQIPENCDTPEVRGEKAFLSLITLVHHYPFSNANGFSSEGIIQGKESVLQGEKVEDYLQWYEDIKTALNHIVYIWKSPNSLLENIAAYQKTSGAPPIDVARNAFLQENREHLKGLERELEALPPDALDERERLVRLRHSQEIRLGELEREALSKHKRLLAFTILTALVEAQDKLNTFSSFRALKRYERVVDPLYRDSLIACLAITFVLGVFLPMVYPLAYGQFFHIVLPLCGHVLSVYCAYQLNSY